MRGPSPFTLTGLAVLSASTSPTQPGAYAGLVERDEIRKNESDRAIAWLDEHWPRGARKCPICSNSTWNIMVTSEMRDFNGTSFVIGGDSGIMPVFQVMCSTCGFLHIFNALHSGVLRPSDYKADEGAS